MPSIISRVLKTLAWVVGVLCALIAVIVLYIQLRWDAGDGRPAPEMKAPTDSVSIARGERIFKYTAHCWSCHQSPDGEDQMLPSGGMVFDLTNIGPGFGIWYSRNITPDVETGIGGWTDGEIVQALREGIRKDRAPLFPVMPIDWYHGMADDDVLAVVAYLRTLPPVKNAVPERQPSFVAKLLHTFGMMAPREPITTPVVAPPRGVTVEYGRYLSSNLADCADCHTPRDLNDGHFFLDSLFAGSSFPFGGGAEGPMLAHALNITPDVKTGIGAWTEEQFMEAITSGMRPDGKVLLPIMPYAYYKFWEPDELQAVYLYLKSLPAISRTVPDVRTEPVLDSARGLQRGSLIFTARCQPCHGHMGGGSPPTNVTLAEVAPSLSDEDLREFLRDGQLNLQMPAFGKTLTDDDFTSLIAFMRSWKK